MSDIWKTIIIFLLIYIFISVCATFIPVKKYQQSYFNIVKESRNKPQQHYDKQIKYANYIEENGELPQELKKTKPILDKTNPKSMPVKTNKPDNNSLKPKYIRDKNNPDILHPYKERKFLFLRFYK